MLIDNFKNEFNRDKNEMLHTFSKLDPSNTTWTPQQFTLEIIGDDRVTVLNKWQPDDYDEDEDEEAITDKDGKSSKKKIKRQPTNGNFTYANNQPPVSIGKFRKNFVPFPKIPKKTKKTKKSDNVPSPNSNPQENGLFYMFLIYIF